MKIDRVKVNNLKELLQHTPDKTQCFIGVIRVVGEDGRRIGMNQVWVNAELYVAKFELESDKDAEEASDSLFAAVHEIHDVHNIDPNIVGSFLNRNSMEFSAKLYEKMSYQDLLRMACVTLNCDKSERSKSFLRSSLRSFSKGNKNVSLFMALASQSGRFLNLFERFVRLYEEGSINGQGLSLKHIVSSKKEKPLKIEVPVSLMKLHLKVNPQYRDELLQQLLEKKIKFPDYRLRLEKSTKLSNVKTHVEKLTGQPFETLKETHKHMLSDEVLSDFTEAKTNSSGPNEYYKQLMQHVNIVVKDVDTQRTPVGEQEELFSIVENDKLTLVDISRKIKSHDLVVLASSLDNDSFNRTYSFALKDEVLKSDDTIGIFVHPVEAELRSEMEAYFDGEGSVVVEYIFMKVPNVVNSGGFKKEYQPVAIVGNKKLFNNKEIRTFHHGLLENSLPLILANCLDAKSKVLYMFDSKNHAIDLDPLKSLAKRKISVTYLAKSEYMQEFAEMMKKKCI